MLNFLVHNNESVTPIRHDTILIYNDRIRSFAYRSGLCYVSDCDVFIVVTKLSMKTYHFVLDAAL